MVIDGAPIRAKAKKDYEKALRELERSRQQINQFESTDRPKFHQWLSREFGALMTELRETHQALEAKRSLLFEVQTEAYRSGSSFGKAYERVMWRREHPEPEPDPSETSSRQSKKSKSGRSEGNIFEEIFGDILDAFEEAFEEADSFGPASNGNSTPPQSSGCKELYRALARRLHPDARGELTNQQTEWWHQVQAAYQAGDVEQLRTILTLCEIDEHGITSKTSVSLLQRSTQQLKLSLRALKRQLSEFRREPAWGFGRLNNLALLRVRMERMLKDELSEVKQMLAEASEQFNAWVSEKRGRSVRRRRHHSVNEQSDFF
jgi:hypothetical protein